MPFKSEAQRRLFFAKMHRGEISRQKVDEWQKATGDRQLPERLHRKKAGQSLKIAYALGLLRALEENSLEKQANVSEWMAEKLVNMGLPLIAMGGVGAALAGPDNRTEGALAGVLGGLAGKALMGRVVGRAVGGGQLAESARALGDSEQARRLSQEAMRALASTQAAGQWTGRLAGAGVAGLGLRQLNRLSAEDSPTANAQPANYDIGGQYTGLLPDYSDALLGI